MAKRTKKAGNPWTRAHVKEVRKLVKMKLSTRDIGKRLGRTDNAVRSVAGREGISLRK